MVSFLLLGIYQLPSSLLLKYLKIILTLKCPTVQGFLKMSVFLVFECSKSQAGKEMFSFFCFWEYISSRADFFRLKHLVSVLKLFKYPKEIETRLCSLLSAQYREYINSQRAAFPLKYSTSSSTFPMSKRARILHDVLLSRF
jgi:hypothetical protein